VKTLVRVLVALALLVWLTHGIAQNWTGGDHRAAGLVVLALVVGVAWVMTWPPPCVHGLGFRGDPETCGDPSCTRCELIELEALKPW
jgi:hypothetical protein